MKKSLSIIGLGLVLALPVPGLRAQAVGSVLLAGHVPAIVKGLPAVGHFTATNLDLAIGLPLRNREALTNLLQQINDPFSTNYHKYLSPAQFAEQFSPTEEDYLAVANFARQNGLKVTGTHANRILLEVSGASADIEKAFKVSFKTYQHPTEGRQFFATDVEPSVPAGVPAQDVSGLDNYNRPYPHLAYKPISAATSLVSKATGKVVANSGTGPAGTYMGNDFRNAYIPGTTTLNGAGQTVALVQFDGYYASDINQYEGMAGRTNIPLKNILLDGFNGLPTGNGGEVEVSLDIEMVISMAPAIAQVNVYEDNPYNFHPNTILNRIATDDSANQVSSSWTWTGGPSATTDQIFQQMALQGQTVFFASGDGDAYPAGTVDAPYNAGYPSDSAFVTSVGGTTLTMTPGGASRVSETVWNWGIEYGFDGVGSSGGISTYYKIPYWQTNTSMTACQGSAVNRNFPDVALTGDNVFVIADGGVEYLVGGTSCATPLWAGFTSMINQDETNFNHGPIGFINPALYALSAKPGYSTDFNDITTGNNTWSQSPTLFYAVTNYDLCTGLGTPNGTNLINALVSVPEVAFRLSAPPATYGSTLSALNGGSPNGAWALFIQDNFQFNTGMISNGWIATVTLGSPVGAEADLGLTLVASASTVQTNSNLIYYITVTNYGGLSTATNVLVQDTLPDGVSLVGTNASVGLVTRSGTTVDWAVGTLTNNAGATLALTVQAPSTPGSILDFALAQSDTPDPNPADSAATVSVTVGGSTAGQLIATASFAGGKFTLTITGSSTSPTYIEASTNLENGWSRIYTNVAPFTFTDSNEHQFTNRFFRAVTGP